ncbi:MAG: hypothetical protein H6619_06875 [Deltaproteobacteria bacterium]|nr:hypothetical protein [Deltaproteobacteria bacterium]
MASLISDKISRRERQDIASLRGKRRKSNYLLILAAFAFVVCSILYFTFSYFTIHQDESFHRLAVERTSELEETALYYGEWLEANLGAGTRSFYDFVATTIISSSDFFPVTKDYVSRSWHLMHVGFLRVAFVFVGWWRFWLLGAAIAFWFGSRGWKVYRGGDILGRLTNGRLFYSGIRADLKKVTSAGAPSVQAPGLACPQYVQAAEAKMSALGRTLERRGVLNQTNLMLASIILAHRDIPSYVALKTETELLERAYAGSSLPDNTNLLIEGILALQEHYIVALEAGESVNFSTGEIPYAGQYTPEKYITTLVSSLHKVLTPQMREDIAEIAPSELATIVLSLEAGKVMAYTVEGDRYVRGSSFPQLCARSVLHSIPQYSLEYDFEQRGMIRRALIYASRKSVYGPVKLLVDFDPKTRAARQWTELLLAVPHEIEFVSDEVELYGLIYSTHQKWKKLFFDAVMVADQKIIKKILNYSQNLFVPFDVLMKTLYKSISKEEISRLKVLVDLVSQRQQMVLMQSGPQSIPDYQKIFPSFSDDELSKLSKDHGLKKEELSDWSALRVMLNHYSWLGRRVRNNTIPESSIVFLETKTQKGDLLNFTYENNYYTGSVVLRGSQLIDKWGEHWAQHFEVIDEVTAVDEISDFEKLKRGESIEDDDLISVENG